MLLGRVVPWSSTARTVKRFSLSVGVSSNEATPARRCSGLPLTPVTRSSGLAGPAVGSLTKR